MGKRHGEDWCHWHLYPTVFHIHREGTECLYCHGRPCGNPASKTTGLCHVHGKVVDEAYWRGVHEERARWRAAEDAESVALREHLSRNPGFIYYAEREGYVKIGHAADVRQRLKALLKGGVLMPPGMTFGPLVLLAQHAGTQEIERYIHQRFRGSRINGEWFTQTDDLKDHIRLVNEKGYDPFTMSIGQLMGVA